MTQEQELIKQLLSKDEEYENDIGGWLLNELLADGGAKVTDEVKNELLIVPFEKHDDITKSIAKSASYHNHMGNIISLMQTHIMGTSFNVVPSQNTDFWLKTVLIKRFFVEGKQVDFRNFLSYCVKNALTQGKCFALVELDEENELVISAWKRTRLIDWGIEGNEISFVKLLKAQKVKEKWFDEPKKKETIIIYQQKEDGFYYASVYNIFTEKTSSGKQKRVEVVKENVAIYRLPDGTKALPLVELSYPAPLYLGEQLFDLQREHFNHLASTNWALFSTNYATLTFYNVTKESQIQERMQVMGNGYYLTLPPDVTAEWLSRDTAGIKIGMEKAQQTREELYSTIATIAAINDKTSIRRSGESKKEDKKAMKMLLQTYGQITRMFAQQILQTAAIANNESTDITVNGFENYDSDTLLTDLEEFREAQGVVTNSPTFNLEGQKAIALKASEAIGISRAKRKQIISEIETSSVTQQTTEPPVNTQNNGTVSQRN